MSQGNLANAHIRIKLAQMFIVESKIMGISGDNSHNCEFIYGKRLDISCNRHEFVLPLLILAACKPLHEESHDDGIFAEVKGSVPCRSSKCL